MNDVTELSRDCPRRRADDAYSPFAFPALQVNGRWAASMSGQQCFQRQQCRTIETAPFFWAVPEPDKDCRTAYPRGVNLKWPFASLRLGVSILPIFTWHNCALSKQSRRHLF